MKDIDAMNRDQSRREAIADTVFITMWLIGCGCVAAGFLFM